MLHKVSSAIRDSYISSSEYGISFFSKYSSQVRNFDKCEFIAFQMEHYELRYVLDMWLSLEELCVGIDRASLMKLAILVEYRPAHFRFFSDIGCYADIHFCFQYLRINILPSLFESKGLKISQKLGIINYCTNHADLLVPSTIDLSDLDGAYYVDISTIERIRCDLIEQGMPEFSGESSEIKLHALQLSRMHGLSVSDK